VPPVVTAAAPADRPASAGPPPAPPPGLAPPTAPPGAAGSWAAAAAAAGLAALLLLPGLGAAPFDDPGEGQHVEIAREAASTGQWLTLRLNGLPYLEKPPLLYALVALALRLGGESETSARLPSALAAAAAVAGTALLGARRLGAAGGCLAGAALLSCALFAAFGRYVRPETLFVAAIQWGFTGLLLGLPGAAGGRGRAGWSLAGCLALGLAALAKDPLGLLGPLAAVALALGLAGRLRPWRAWLPARGLALLGVVGFGWYAAAAVAHRDFIWYVVVENHARGAVLRRHFPDEDVPLGALEFLAGTAFGAFPWIVPAALMAAGLARRRAWRDPAELPWVALAAWAAGVLAVFTVLPFRLPHYGLPAMPAIALLAARWWMERPARSRRAALGHLVLLAGLAGAALWLHAAGGAGMDAVLATADATARKAPAAAVGAGVPEWRQLAPLVAGVAAVLAVGALGLAAAALARAPRAAAAVTAAAALGLLPLVAGGLGAVAEARAVRGLAGELRLRMRAGDLLVHEGPLERSAALELYAGRRPVLLDGTRSVLGYAATLPGAEETFWSAERLRHEWRGPRRLWLVTTRAPGAGVAATLPPGSAELVTSQAGRQLYTNRALP
jgi:4-amino-4-deoxy-L-arabinose transferase-like glycosyltransferase